MSAIDSVFKSLSKLPLRCRWHLPKPLFYPKNSNSIIISTDFEETNAGVFKYNIDSNNLEMLLNYGSIKLEDHAQFINYINDTLHILSPDENLHVTIDLKTNKINNQQKNEFSLCPKCVEISSPKRQEVHVVADFHEHFKFDCKTNCNDLIRVNSKNYKLSYIYGCKLLYAPTKEQLMILGGNSDDRICYCNIKEPNQWKLMSSIKMPFTVVNARDYDILVFYDVIIVFYFIDKEDIYDIWFLDLLDYKWYKSKHNVPKSIVTDSVFIQNNNNSDIHVLDFYHQLHFKVNTHDLFSNDIIKQRIKYYEILVMGFVKGEENNMVINIPFVVKQLILIFYPLFGYYK